MSKWLLKTNKNNYHTYLSDVEIDIMDSASIATHWKLYFFTFRVKYFDNYIVYIQICFYAILWHFTALYINIIIYIYMFILIRHFPYFPISLKKFTSWEKSVSPTKSNMNTWISIQEIRCITHNKKINLSRLATATF